MYEVRSVVSDYGIYEEKEDKLIAIMNNYNNAIFVWEWYMSCSVFFI